MNTRFYLTTIFLLLSGNIFCYFNLFSNNPASLAPRQHQEFSIPFLNFELHMDNSLLSFKDVEIFEKARILTSADKRLLTKKDLNLTAELNSDILHYGYYNWDFSFSIHSFLDANIIDKKLSEIVFNGNDPDKDYLLNSGEGTFAIAFTKNRLGYGHPEPFDVLDIPVYVGTNINIYSPLFFAEVLESSQRFITTPDSSYYDYRLRYSYVDEEELGNPGASLGFGFGIKAQIPNGWAYLAIDDLFASLKYENLASGLYEGSAVDSLLYLTEDFKPFSDNHQNETLRIKEKRYRINPVICFGGNYNVYDRIYTSLKYSYSDYSHQRGLTLAVNYDPLDWLPLMLVIGSSAGNNYFEFRTGLNITRFQLLLSPVYYNGFFDRTKGVGIKTGMKVIF